MCYGHECAGLWMIVGGALMFLFWGGIIGLVAWGIVRLTRRSHGENGGFAIARERYARGEIRKEEFDQMKKDLK
jgi:putative membrane protein